MSNVSKLQKFKKLSIQGKELWIIQLDRCSTCTVTISLL